MWVIQISRQMKRLTEHSLIPSFLWYLTSFLWFHYLQSELLTIYLKSIRLSWWDAECRVFCKEDEDEAYAHIAHSSKQELFYFIREGTKERLW